MNYFTSDLHLGDDVTIQVERRPFSSARVFDKFIINQINKQAKADDTIYVIGDMMDCDGLGFELWRKTIHYVKKINAKVVLIIGNNEERIVRHYFENDFNKFRELCLGLGYKDVVKNATLKIANKKFYLTHKPSECKKDMLNLFGHVHRQGGLYYPFGINVSCDLNFFRLYSEEDIKYMLARLWPHWKNDPELHIKFE